MIDSRIPIIHKHPELSQARILFSSDMHVGSRLFEEKRWNEFEKEIMKPDTFVIFAGDQMEYATPRSKSSVYETNIHPREAKRWWIDHMKPYKDKVICIVDGNHEWNRASREADAYPLYDIALALGIETCYRSEAAFVDFSLGRWSVKGHHGESVSYIFRVQHKAKNLVNFGTADYFDGIDIFVAGHSHMPLDKPLPKLVYDAIHKSVRTKDVENFVCGSFLGYGGYAERDAMRPASKKNWAVILNGSTKKIKTEGFYV